jgi:N-acetylglutamate synthase-like GNAT family acetyltransferase
MDDHSQIRDAAHHDLEGITQLEAEVFPNPWSLETFHGFLPTAAMLVATWEGTVVGYVLARALGGDEGEVLNIAVAVSVRRNRVGSGLLQRALDRLTTFGVQHTYLEVRESSFGRKDSTGNSALDGSADGPDITPGRLKMPWVFAVASTQHMGSRKKAQNRVSLVDKRTCRSYSLLPSSVPPLNIWRVSRE